MVGTCGKCSRRIYRVLDEWYDLMGSTAWVGEGTCDEGEERGAVILRDRQRRHREGDAEQVDELESFQRETF